jgi:hypothetical protein
MKNLIKKDALPTQNHATFSSRTLRRTKITQCFLPAHCAEQKSRNFFFPHTAPNKKYALFSSRTLRREKITQC